MMLWRKILLLLILATALTASAVAAPEPLTEQAAVVRVGPEEIRGYLDDFVQSRADLLPQAVIRFHSLDLPAAFTLPAGKLAVEVIPADPQILSSRRFTLIFRVDGRAEKNIAVRGEIEALAAVAVAAGDLRRGTTLTARDINMATLDLAGLRYPCFDPAELIDRKMKRSVRLGEAIGRGDIEIPPLVKRGEMVTMTARRGTLVVTARGVARQDGEEGGFIRVLNTSSQKEIVCRVSAPGRVDVEF